MSLQLFVPGFGTRNMRLTQLGFVDFSHAPSLSRQDNSVLRNASCAGKASNKDTPWLKAGGRERFQLIATPC